MLDNNQETKVLRLSIKPHDLRCGICIAKFDRESDQECIRRLPCKHSFHIDCTTEWFKISPKCPLCEYKQNPEDFTLS